MNWYKQEKLENFCKEAAQSSQQDQQIPAQNQQAPAPAPAPAPTQSLNESWGQNELV